MLLHLCFLLHYAVVLTFTQDVVTKAVRTHLIKYKTLYRAKIQSFFEYLPLFLKTMSQKQRAAFRQLVILKEKCAYSAMRPNSAPEAKS